MIGHHPAFDAAYRATLLLLMTNHETKLDQLLGSDVEILRAMPGPDMRFIDSHRKRIHSSIELHPELRAEVSGALTVSTAGTACWLWLTRPIPEWEQMVIELTRSYDETTLRTRERDRLAASLEERTEQWRTVMRQLSVASAELQRIGSTVLEETPTNPLTTNDWDAILSDD